MNEITEPAREYSAGHEFNYAAWNADTVLTFCNVPWNNDYRDIVKFDNQIALNNYIDGLQTSHGNITTRYARVNMPINVDIPFNRMIEYNYVRASNKAQPIQGGDVARTFYYFITNVRYVAPNNTEITVQLDVWQTFGFGVTFGNCYIQQGHIGIANSKAFDNYGRDYLTTPEGLDVGSEYRVIARSSKAVMHSRRASHGTPADNEKPNVIVLSSIQLFGEKGTVKEPVKEMSVPRQYGASTFGLGAYIFEDQYEFEKFLKGMTDYPWILNGIQSITLVPNIKRYHPNFEFGSAFVDGVQIKVAVFDDGKNINPSGWSGVGVANPNDGYPNRLTHEMFENWRNSDTILNNIPERYRHLKKFLTYPYMFIEATTWMGNNLVIKPEAWRSAHATLHERANIMPPTQRVTFTVWRYNASADYATGPNGDDSGDFLDMAINIDAFPSIPIMNDQGIMYLAQNAHSLAYAFQSADWSQQRAMASARTSYDQQTAGIRAAQDQASLTQSSASAMTGFTNDSNQQMAILNAIGGIAEGAAGGAAAGGARGAIGGAAAGAVGVPVGMIRAHMEAQRASQITAMNNRQVQSGADISTGLAGYNRDTNNDLARYAAQGDYQNTIAGINAKTQDAMLTQPSVKGQYGGDLIHVNYGTSEISLRWRMIDPAALAVIGEYWLRYGYAVNRFGRMPASLMVMSKFTYWKLAETYITNARMPETFKQAIRGIFEKGVTVWKNPADIGNIDTADNVALNGVSL